MKLYNLFRVVATCVCTLVFGAIAVGVATTFTLPGVSVLLVVLLLALLVWLYRRIDGHEHDHAWQSRVTIVLFALMALLMAGVLFFVAPRPMTDSFEDIDAAMYLVQNGVMDDGFGYIGNVAAYGNNQLFIVLLAGFFRILLACGIQDVLVPLMVANLLAVLGGEYVFWRTMRECRGEACANKFLLFCALNPLYYGLVCWLYTMTFSLPLMAGILYGALRIRRATTLRASVGWGSLMGALVVLGYGIRATSVFPFVAIVLVGGLLLIGSSKEQRKRVALASLSLVVVAVVAHGAASAVQDRYFGELADRAYPVSYWLAMGSNEEGTLKGRAEYRKIANDMSLSPEERSRVLWQSTASNYKELGVVGTLRLWLSKTLLTWSDGYSWINVRTRLGQHKGPLYDVIAGNHCHVFKAYCEAFRMVTVLGVAYGCVVGLRRKELGALELVCVVTLLGAVLFYCVWEAKNVYSGPFVPLMLILATYGVNVLGLQTRAVTQRYPKARFAGLAVIMCLVVVAGVECNALFSQVEERSYARLGTHASNKYTQKLSFNTAVQDFFMSESFNMLKLGLFYDGEDVSARYVATLHNEAGELLASWEFSSEDLREGRRATYVSLPLELVVPSHEDERYVLELQKLDASQQSMSVYTTPTCYLDYFNGQASVDGTPLVGDLMLDVRYVVEEPYLAL